MDNHDDDEHHKPISHRNEGPSLRHFSRQIRPHFCHSSTFEILLEEANTCATAATILNPEESPVLMPSGPSESKWDISPPRYHLLHHCTFSLRHRDGNIHSIEVAKGLVFTGSSCTNIRAWQQTNGSEMGYVQASSGEVRAMLVHNSMLFTSHKDHKIRIWAIGPDGSPPPPSSSCTCGHKQHHSFHHKKIATLPKPSFFRQILCSKQSPQQHRDIVSCMAYNYAHGLLYTGSYDKTVKAWRLSDRKCVDTFVAHSDNINDMVINEDGYIFTCSLDGTLKMWSKVCGEMCHTLTTTLDFQQFPIHALALAAALGSEGSFLYSGSSDGCIYFWEQQMSGEYSHRGCIQGHQFGVLCLAVAEDIVVSGSADTTIKIWRRMIMWKEGDYKVKVCHECVGVLEGHNGPIKCIAACLEEESFVRRLLVFSAGLDRMYKVWKVKILPQTNKTLNNNGLERQGSCGGVIDDNHNNNGDGYYVKCLKDIDAIPVLSPQWVKRIQLQPSLNE